MTNLVVKSEIKRRLENSNLGSDFSEAFEKEVYSLLRKAEKRAEANGRKTVYARDL